MSRFPGPYWIIYYLAYLIAVATLLGLYWDGLVSGSGKERLFMLAAVFGASGGASLTFTITTELGVRAMLLIPAAVKKLKDEGRKEGRQQGHQEGLQEGRDEGRKEGRQEGRQEANQRLQEAFEKFGTDEDGVQVLRRTPEVQEFLRNGHGNGP